MAEFFPHYPSPVDELVGIAAQLTRAAGDTDSTVSDVREGTSRVMDAVDGDLTFPMSVAPNPTISAGANVAEASRFASGAVMYFAQAVQTYNAGIDRLNAQVPSDGFDVMSMGRAQLLQRLMAEQARLERDLDTAAARVAGMLDRGPNPDDLAFLDDGGYLLPTHPDLTDVLASMPPRDDPDAMREWWDSLTLAQQVAMMADRPERLGNTDGLPAEIRDEANRLVLADDLERLRAEEAAGTLTDEERRVLDNIERVMRNLEDRESHVDPVTGVPVHAQLYIYDPYAFDGDGRVAIAAGNLDDADHIAVMVPGMGTTVQGMGAGRSLNVYDESRWASGDSIAVLDWVGYDAPSGAVGNQLLEVANRDLATDGAEQLAADVDGLRASRDDAAHLTVIGNSYGSTTSAIAADEFDLDADDLILTGSPGAGGADNADDLTTGTDHTWVGSGSYDFVTYLGASGSVDTGEWAAELADLVPGMDVELMGRDPAESGFDANRFEAESVDRDDSWLEIQGLNIDDHGRYYDENSESLYNVAAITTGQYEDVQAADGRTDPFLDVDADLQSPVDIHRPGIDVELGWPPVQIDPGIEIRPPVDVDVRFGPTSEAQDPERDRDPEEMTHG
jgi:Alpha/beta hydrolase